MKSGLKARAVISNRLKQRAAIRSADTTPVHVCDVDLLPETEAVVSRPRVAGLSEEDRKVLETGGCLNDKLMKVGQNLLNHQFHTWLAFRIHCLDKILPLKYSKRVHPNPP